MKNLLSFLTFLILLLFAIPSSAQFYAFDDITVDFSAINSNFGSYDNQQYFNWDSPGDDTTTIYQNWDGASLKDGDTFTEYGWMYLSSLDGAPNPDLYDESTETQYYMSLMFSGLEGYIYDISADQTAWDYTFTANTGTIGMYLHEEINNDSGGVAERTDVDAEDSTTWGTQIAEMSVIEGAGTADGFLAGDAGDAVSNWNTILQIDSMTYTDFLRDSGGNSLWDLYGSEGLLLANPQGVARLDSEPIFGDDQITFQGHTGDDMKVGTVPEPTTLLLFGTGLLGLAVLGRKRFLKTQN